MSKVIRTGQVSGAGVVTLGRAEGDLYFDPAADRGKAPTVDVEALMAARTKALREGLDTEWEGRLRQEHDTMRAAGERQLAEAEERHRAEVERVHQGRYDEGFRDGVTSKEDEAREAVQRLAVLHESLKADRAQVILDAQTLVSDLAVAVARRVTRVTTAYEPTVVARTLKAALQQLAEGSNLVVKVHHDDLQIARRFAAAWVERVDQDAVLKIQVSDHVNRGGCMVEGGEENVDARLESQLDVLQQALRDEVEEDYDEAEALREPEAVAAEPETDDGASGPEPPAGGGRP